MDKTVEQLKIMLQADVMYEKYLATRRYITMYDKVVKKGLQRGYDLSNLISNYRSLNVFEVKEIEYGLDNDLDISIYAKEYYTWGQMHEIRVGLEQGLDVSIYAKETYTGEQMREIRHEIEQRLDVGLYAKDCYNWMQM